MCRPKEERVSAERCDFASKELLIYPQISPKAADLMTINATSICANP
jgi:hypothetical protein